MKNTSVAIGLVGLAIAFVVLAGLYWVGSLQVLVSHPAPNAPHHSHAFAFGALAVLSLVAANFARPKTA